MSAHIKPRESASPAYDMPLDKIDVSQPELFPDEFLLALFRAPCGAEDPVHYCAQSDYGAFWSVTMYNDIMAVDTNHQVFSSEASLGGHLDPQPAARLPAADVHRPWTRPSTTSSARS